MIALLLAALLLLVGGEDGLLRVFLAFYAGRALGCFLGDGGGGGCENRDVWKEIGNGGGSGGNENGDDDPFYYY